MALRIEKAIGACLIALWTVNAASAAEQNAVAVRHKHLRKGGAGELQLRDSSLAFREVGKKQNHSREWPIEEIQQLYVSPNTLRVLTYEDVSWKLGKDRKYEFDQLPEGAAQRILSDLRRRIDDRRVVVAMPDLSLTPLWQIRAKLVEGRGGSEGVLLVGEDSIVYNSLERGASRTWRFRQIDNISSSGPFDLTITTFEQSGSRFAGRRDFRFQLKTELPEQRYNTLWRRLTETRLLQSSITSQLKEK